MRSQDIRGDTPEDQQGSKEVLKRFNEKKINKWIIKKQLYSW